MMTESAPPPPDPEVLEVPLSVYAAVLGYTTESVPLEMSLDHAALTAEEWPAVDAAWTARLAESAMGDGALIEACDQHRFASEAHVERSLPPLDEDLRSWLDFFRAFTAAEDPLGFLEIRRLVEVDLFRLLSLWQARSASEKTLQEATARILAEPPGPIPRVEPRPAALRAETRRARRAAPVPVNTPPEKPSLGETSMVLDLSKIVLPFARSSGVAPLALSTVKAPVVRARRDFGETKLAVSAPAKPATPFAREGSRAVVEAPPIPSPAWPASAPATAPIAPPKRPLAETSFAAEGMPLPVLPFAAPAPGAPSGGVQPPSAPPVVARPNPLLSGTSMAATGPARAALPFGQEGAPPPRGPAPSIFRTSLTPIAVTLSFSVRSLWTPEAWSDMPSCPASSLIRAPDRARGRARPRPR